MIVSRDQFHDTLALFNTPGIYALDTETTGLNAYKDDRLFSIALSNGKNNYYFNFNYNKGVDIHPWLTLPKEWFLLFREIFSVKESTFRIHNAKFDLAMLYKEGLEIKGIVHCTAAIHRIIRNDLFSYELDALSKFIGGKKSKTVEEYIKQNKLSEKIIVAGEEIEVKHYELVPLDIIAPYAEMDVELCWKLGDYQEKELRRLDEEKKPGINSIYNVANNEKELTKVCFEIEKIGALVDVEYCKKALEEERARASIASEEFYKLTGTEFVDSGKVFKEVFDSLNITYGKTAKGRPSFKADILEEINHPVAKCILDYRAANKKASTYYSNFLYYKDSEGRIHANLKQFGAGTGRMSVTDPNMQNLKKEAEAVSEDEMRVRRTFIPTPGFCFLMIDYDQMEYRFLLEAARELELIEKINYGGLDVHEATARTMGVVREKAKTLNFMLLYGGGAAKLAAMLNIPLEEAIYLKAKYFVSLPKVKEFVRAVIWAAETFGKITNWFGRPYFCSNKDFAYKMVDYLIQGGCADVVKIAMVRLWYFLRDKKSRMIMQIHDEILFEIHESEIGIELALKKIMEEAFSYKYIKLTCSVSHSWKSWAHKTKGQIIRKEISVC